MKFGLFLAGLGPKHIAAVAQAAEANGFESVWTPDHLVMPVSIDSPYPYRDDGQLPFPSATPMLDPWIVLSAAASATERIRIGTNVYVAVLRHPFVTARTAATLDRFSGGRLTLGIGVGWMAEEFEAAQVPFGTRGECTDEIVPLLRRLWQEETVEHQGKFFQFPEVCFAPKPSQKPTIPIEVGGTSRPAMRRAAHLGDGWIETGVHELSDLTELVKFVQAERLQGERTHDRFEMTTSFPHDRTTAMQCVDLGFTRALVRPPMDAGPPQKAFLEWIPRFADEVIATCGD